MPETFDVNPELQVPLAELEWRFSASGGPGGQHANTSNTRAEVTFDIASSPTLNAAQRRRLAERYGSRLRIVASDERSQTRNREIALERLAAKLAAGLHRPKRRRATRPTRASKRRRAEAKKRQSQKKQSRKPPAHE